MRFLPAFLMALLASWSGSVQAAQRPNILWISCEDISPHLGCYGDPQATTPHIDQLAREGVRYTHAFVTAGVCAPCRSTVITGMYQTTIGTHHMRCNAQLPDDVKPFTIPLREAGYYCTNNSKKDYQFKEPKETWDVSSGKAHWRARPDPKQPFFAVFNFTECHESGIASDSKYETVTRGIEKHDPAALKSLPPYYPDTPVTRADWARYYDVVTAMDRRAGEILAQLKEDGLDEDTIVFFWSDHGVGLPRAKRWLYDSGMRVPLVVRIPEKWRRQGFGTPGTVSDRLVSLMDLGPTVLSLAGLKVPHLMQGKAFLGAEEAPARYYVFGARDRMDERYDIIRAVRDHRYKYIRNYQAYKTWYQYMNTPEQGRTMAELRRLHEAGQLPPAAEQFFGSHKTVEELYDTEKDPHELVNLASDPKYQAILERLRKEHLQWVANTRDVGLIPEPEIVEREKALGSRYAILRQTSDPTLNDRLREISNLAVEPGAHAAELLEALKDPDAAVRHWAAIGLGNLTRAYPPASPALKQSLRDDSASVRLAAARALAAWGDADSALPVLEKELASKEEWVRLNAAIVLDEMDEAARPALRALKSALKDKENKYVVRVANRAVNELEGTSNKVP